MSEPNELDAIVEAASSAARSIRALLEASDPPRSPEDRIARAFMLGVVTGLEAIAIGDGEDLAPGVPPSDHG